MAPEPARVNAKRLHDNHIPGPSVPETGRSGIMVTPKKSRQDALLPLFKREQVCGSTWDQDGEKPRAELRTDEAKDIHKSELRRLRVAAMIVGSGVSAAPGASRAPLVRFVTPGPPGGRIPGAGGSIGCPKKPALRLAKSSMYRQDRIGFGIVTCPAAPGLMNLGNTCYLNAVLQSVGALSEFVTDLQQCSPETSLHRHSVEILGTMLAASNPGANQDTPQSPLDPAMVRTIVASVLPSFDNFLQQDAHEFFLEYLNLLHDEMLDFAKTKADRDGTTLLDIQLPTHLHFDFELRLRNKCNKCGYTSLRTELFRDLSLDFALALPGSSKPSLEGLLNSYFADEKVELRCSCGHQHATQRRQIRRPPRVLALHLKRFIPYFEQGVYGKRHDNIEIPLVLEMSPYLLQRDEEMGGEGDVIDVEDLDCANARGCEGREPHACGQDGGSVGLLRPDEVARPLNNARAGPARTGCSKKELEDPQLRMALEISLIDSAPACTNSGLQEQQQQERALQMAIKASLANSDPAHMEAERQPGAEKPDETPPPKLSHSVLHPDSRYASSCSPAARALSVASRANGEGPVNAETLRGMGMMTSPPKESAGPKCREHFFPRPSCRYALRAVVCHCGSTPESGHYVTWVRIEKDAGGGLSKGTPDWRCFDDTRVSVESSRAL
jgi:ubiquitin C-terminal hydrolase